MTRIARLRRRLRATSPTDQAVRVALGLMLLSGAVAGTSASFNGSTANTSAPTFAIDSLNPPSAVVASASGNNAVIGWSGGTVGSSSATYSGCTTTTLATTGSGGCTLASTYGHRVRERNLGVEPGTRDGQDPPTASCTTATSWTATTGNPANGVNTLTDTSVASGAQGSWWCYMVDSIYPAGSASPTWVSQDSSAAQVALVQLGNVTRSVEFVNGNGNAGTLGTGDSIVFSYAQPITTSTGPVDATWTGSAFSGNAICSKSGQELNFGRTGTSATCANAETNWVGTLTPAIGSGNSAWEVDWQWSSCTVPSTLCSVLTAVLGTSRGTNATTTITLGTGFTPTTVAGKLTSATGAVAMCNTTNTTTVTCRPATFGTV